MQVHGPGYRLPRSGVRTLHIDGVEYRYAIKGSQVLFFLPDRKVVADLSEVSGKRWDLLERGQWKGTSDGHVTPRHCRDFLEQLLNQQNA